MTAPYDKDEVFGHYASPPCFMHELDPAYLGVPEMHDRDVKDWRRAERRRLIARRLALHPDERQHASARIRHRLDETVGDPSGLVVSGYWPWRGEPDLRAWLALVHARGGRCALPVVTARNEPLTFRHWQPGDRMARGSHGIPEPVHGEAVVPDVVVAPVVGFDDSGYRLGYGGGFYDRTLAHLSARPRAIGVGFSAAHIPTIHPRPHDISMDLIVTEREVHAATAPRADVPGLRF